MLKTTEDNLRDRGPAQTTGAVVYAYDVTGKITFLNHEGERLLGYSEEEACRMNIAEVIDPQIAGRVGEQIIRDARARVGSVYEIDIITKDGHRVPLEISTQVVVGEGDRIEVQGIAVLSVIRNQSSILKELRCSDPDALLRQCSRANYL